MTNVRLSDGSDGHARGTVLVDGEVVGAFQKDLKHGYHPIAALQVGTARREFELDTPNLADAARAEVRKILNLDEEEDR